MPTDRVLNFTATFVPNKMVRSLKRFIGPHPVREITTLPNLSQEALDLLADGEVIAIADCVHEWQI